MQIKNSPWHIAINQETGSKWGTNGKVMLAIEFHPYELVKRRATHHSLLEYQENPGINLFRLYKSLWLLVLEKSLMNEA